MASFFNRRQPSVQTADVVDLKKSGQAESEWAAVLNIKKEVLKVWRFRDQDKPEPVPEDEVGYFYSADNYCVLKTSNKNTKLCYDIHFWVGGDRASTPSASPPIKVKELMAVLDDKVVLHKEVQGFESPEFKHYFKVFGIIQGGSESNFDHERPKEYRPRLLHFELNKEKTRTVMREVEISWKSLTPLDVYIYDEGTKMTQWNGARCDEEERKAARKYIESALKKRKCKCTTDFYDQEDLLEQNELHTKLGDANVKKPIPQLAKRNFEKSMHRLSDETSKLVLTKVYTGKIYRSGINANDVNFIDSFHVLYVYIGPGASENEKESCWDQATKYLQSVNQPNKSIALFTAGSYCQGFNEVWDDLK